MTVYVGFNTITYNLLLGSSSIGHSLLAVEKICIIE